VTDKLISAGCDWASVSVSGDGIKALMEYSLPSANGDCQSYWKGYREHETRCLKYCGVCDRHKSPYQKSREHGFMYELWNWRGEQALRIGCGLNDVPELKRSDIRCTRLDMKFDFQFWEDASVRPMDIRDGWKAVWQDEKGLKGEISGEDGTPEHTAYIGGKASGRRIRIYRKDIKDPQHYPGAGGSIIRIELVLKDEWAQKALYCLMDDREAGVRMCAGHIQEMTGWSPLPAAGEIPLAEPKEKSDMGRRIAAVVKQYGLVLAACERNGIDLSSLLKAHVKQGRRSAYYRYQGMNRECEEMGAERILSAASDLLQP